MQKLLIATLLVFPALSFAGGAGTGINLNDYNIINPNSNIETSDVNSTSAFLESSEAPTVRSYRSTRRSTSERRRSLGLRLPSTSPARRGVSTRSRSLRTTKIYTLNGVTYNTYWEWIRAYRAQNNNDLGITRVTSEYQNYGNAYELATGLEPIDPRDNTYRGIRREDERQSAAQLKMMRLRGLR